MTSVSCIIPAYNEAQTIDRLIQQVLAEIWPQPFVLEHIIVVDDCSTDTTATIVQSLAGKDSRVQLIKHVERSGKNAGIRDGLQIGQSDIVFIIDADVMLEQTTLTRIAEALVLVPSLAAVSCINEPLPARTWRERASRFQALLLTETARLGQGSLLRVYALRRSAIQALDLPDTTHDDLYIPRWLHNQGYLYSVEPKATAYMRAAVGLSDFAKQTLRAWQALAALERILPDTQSHRPQRKGVPLNAVLRAGRQEPLGFALYILWRLIVAVTPPTWWLPSVDHSRHDTSLSTKNL